MATGTLSSYLLGAKRYQVVGPVVVAVRMGGGESYVYRHALLPVDTRPSQIENLIEVGLVREFEEAR